MLAAGPLAAARRLTARTFGVAATVRLHDGTDAGTVTLTACRAGDDRGGPEGHRTDASEADWKVPAAEWDAAAGRPPQSGDTVTTANGTWRLTGDGRPPWAWSGPTRTAYRLRTRQHAAPPPPLPD